MTAGAHEVIARVLDAGSFIDWGTLTLPEDPSSAYAEELAAARRRTGMDEAVRAGEGLLKGRRVTAALAAHRGAGLPIWRGCAARRSAACSPRGARSATAPTLSVLLGQGTGGAALALSTADRIVAARHAWLSPLPPEGASVIVHRTTERAAAMAESQDILSAELARSGIVDRMVDERPDAADEPVAFSRRLVAVVEAELLGLLGDEPEERLARRSRKFDSQAIPPDGPNHARLR